MANYRKIFEDYYGVTLPMGLILHHDDFNPDNNDPENFDVFSGEKDHIKIHRERTEKPVIIPKRKFIARALFIDTELFRKFKTKCAARGFSMKSWLIRAIMAWLEKGE